MLCIPQRKTLSPSLLGLLLRAAPSSRAGPLGNNCCSFVSAPGHNSAGSSELILAHMTMHHPNSETVEMLYGKNYRSNCTVVLQLHIQCFVTTWTAAHQASMSFTISQTMRKLPSIESVMPSSHLILCHPLLLFLQYFPASGSFQMSRLFASGGQSTGASASILPMNI